MQHHRPFTVHIDQFEGPLDLMLYLIQSQEMDISTVSISKITDQYLQALKLMQEMDFDLASDFLVMAATLVLWKSKALMPKEGDDQNQIEDTVLPQTQEELIRQLQTRQRFLHMAAKISQRPLLDESVFIRPNKRPPVEKVWKEMNLSQLATTYQDIKVREHRRARVVLKKETVSLSEKIQFFGRRLNLNQITALQELVAGDLGRGEWVVTFLASLELSRLRKLKIYQEQTFDPIYVELLEGLIDFDAQKYSGFNYVNSENGATP